MPDRFNRPQPASALSEEARIRTLLEEYRALHGLLGFRLAAMERHLPVAAGAPWALLGSTTGMPPATKLVFLLGMPAGLLWLLLATVQHARSKEDLLRRIDELERLVNGLAGEELLVFQSRHPNKRGPTAGRTGLRAIVGVLLAALTMLATCTYLTQTSERLLPTAGLAAYAVYAVLCAAVMVRSVVTLHAYRYRRPPPTARPIFEAHFF